MIEFNDVKFDIENIEVDKKEKKIYIALEGDGGVLTIDYATLSLINGRLKIAYDYKIEL